MDASPTDADLLAASDTDAHAFRQLYDRHARTIHGYFARRVAADAAFGLVSETFAAAWISRHHFEDQRGGDAGPWLMGIARHVLLRTLRAGRQHERARERLGLLRADELVVPPPEPADEHPAATEALAALARLPAGQRDAVLLRVVDGCDYSEVASRLDCSPVAARIRVSRGLDTIRGHLNGERHG
jgi:RNA polymerase sigma-70 factor, ECF subfamily